MILEKQSKKVNSKKAYINSPGNWKQTRLPENIGSMGVGGRSKGRRGREREKGRVEANLREWVSQVGVRTDVRARKEIS